MNKYERMTAEDIVEELFKIGEKPTTHKFRLEYWLFRKNQVTIHDPEEDYRNYDYL